MDKNMDRTARKQLVNKLRQGYKQATRAQKSESIQMLMRTAGYNRKVAIRLLNRPLESLEKPLKKRRKPSQYDSILPEIRQIWHAANHICGVRLKAAIPIYLSRMCETREMNPDPQKVHLLLSISDATLDRLLAGDRKRLGLRGLSTTKPGTLLMHQVPIKTFSEWKNTEPGFFAIDWVAFCGESNSGEYISVLSMTSLNLHMNQVSEINALSTCTALKSLNISYNHVSNLTPIMQLPSLEELTAYEDLDKKIIDRGQLTTLIGKGVTVEYHK